MHNFIRFLLLPVAAAAAAAAAAGACASLKWRLAGHFDRTVQHLTWRQLSSPLSLFLQFRNPLLTQLLLL